MFCLLRRPFFIFIKLKAYAGAGFSIVLKLFAKFLLKIMNLHGLDKNSSLKFW